MTFAQMLKEVRIGMGLQQSDFAEQIGYSAQYVCDLENERRAPSVKVVNSICEWMGRGPKGRREWHTAGARAHGWEV